MGWGGLDCPNCVSYIENAVWARGRSLGRAERAQGGAAGRIRVLSVTVLSPHLPHASRRRERCVGSLNSTPAVPPACPCLTPRPCFGSWLVPALLHQHAAGPWPPPRLPGLREHAAPRRQVRLYIGTVSTSPASFRQIGHNLFLRLQQLQHQPARRAPARRTCPTSPHFSTILSGNYTHRRRTGINRRAGTRGIQNLRVELHPPPLAVTSRKNPSLHPIFHPP